MALFTKVTIVDGRGNAHTVSGGILSNVKIQNNQDGSVCIHKTDALGISTETTCIQKPVVYPLMPMGGPPKDR